MLLILEASILGCFVLGVWGEEMEATGFEASGPIQG